MPDSGMNMMLSEAGSRNDAAALAILVALVSACATSSQSLRTRSAAAAAGPPGTDTRLPAWNYAPLHTDYCVDGTTAAHPNNKRLVFVALPEGKPPPRGWPVYFWFVVDSFPSKNHSFGGPAGTPGSCEPVTRDPTQQVPQPIGPFDPPARLLLPCLGIFNGSEPLRNADCSGGAGCTCDYDDLSGLLWAQQEKAAMISNGVAVVQLNPWGGDSWDAGPPVAGFAGWGRGPDAVVFELLLGRMKRGELGHLDLSQIFFRGWSGGAQMVSWMVQLQAIGALAALGKSNARMVGGVYTSGGSYMCYPANSSTTAGAYGVCTTCNASVHCAGAGFAQESGCSTCTKNCGAIRRNGPPCCSKCCPTGFTEEHFHSHPQDWPLHPPAFLAQGSTLDGNADLCAAKNYHETLVANNVSSTLVLQPAAYERCGCLGQQSDPAAARSVPASSPLVGLCEKNAAQTTFCHTHVMAFAEMVRPLVVWVKNILT